MVNPGDQVWFLDKCRGADCWCRDRGARLRLTCNACGHQIATVGITSADHVGVAGDPNSDLVVWHGKHPRLREYGPDPDESEPIPPFFDYEVGAPDFEEHATAWIGTRDISKIAGQTARARYTEKIGLQTCNTSATQDRAPSEVNLHVSGFISITAHLLLLAKREGRDPSPITVRELEYLVSDERFRKLGVSPHL